jgi:ketosteroid isomerase-like protein
VDSDGLESETDATPDVTQEKSNGNRHETGLQARRPDQALRRIRQRGDAEGLAGLYEHDAIVAFPPGKLTVGHDAIKALYEQMLAAKPHFRLETPLPTLVMGDIALTATPALDEAGARAQVVRRQPDGSWLRVLDRPDFRG